MNLLMERQAPAWRFWRGGACQAVVCQAGAWRSGLGVPGLAFRAWRSGLGDPGLAFRAWRSGLGVPVIP